MNYEPVTELRLVTVLNRGVPNQECVALNVMQSIDMGKYALIVAYQQSDGTAHPYRDQFFWFGHGTVQAGDWIFLYTGEGSPRVTEQISGIGKSYAVHWGRTTTMFANSAVVPILIRVDALTVCYAPADVPQAPLLPHPRNAKK
jgi:hypothetical protein